LVILGSSFLQTLFCNRWESRSKLQSSICAEPKLPTKP
jgi:hypothetical protein